MADERRLLQSLERVRVRGAAPIETTERTRHGVSGLDDIEAQLHAAVAVADATPSRRPSSALTLSHLAAATPPALHTNATSSTVVATLTPPLKSAVTRQAVRDLASELDAVEARLSGFRKRREASEATECGRKSEELQTSTDSHEHASVREQRAGEVADQVEHALANCDRLLHHAQLQASGSDSVVAMASSTREARFASRRDEPRPVSSSDKDEIALETTARTMRALVASHEAAIERDAARVVAQSQQTQARQLQELQRKCASRTKMALRTLREQCDEQTRAIMQQAMRTHAQAEQDAVRRAEEALLRERQRRLQELSQQQQQEIDTRVQRVRVKIESETLDKKQQLEKQLQAELDEQLKRIDEHAAAELLQWEAKQRLVMERDVLARREQAAAAVLRAQEMKTNELKQQWQQQSATKEQDELAKLQTALAFGAQAQLQQLRKTMEAAHEQRVHDTRTDAALTLDSKLTDLKQVLTLAHKHELEQLTRDLDKRHRVAVMALHEQMEKDHRAGVQELTQHASKELDQVLARQRKELETQNQAKLAALEQTLDRDHRVRMHELDLENDAQCELALQQLRQRIHETQQRELEAKHARMNQAKATLLDEAVQFLTIKRQGHWDGGSAPSTEALVHLKQLSTQPLLKELQRAVAMLVKDFEKLTAEQSILIDKISECTGLYLACKRQCAHMESEVHELRDAVQTLHAQLQTKDALAKKLYAANEALLAKLGLSDDHK